MNTTLSISILSGKGGVGKTNISLNMAYGLYQLGYKPLLMDCDMGLANLDVLLGITPEANLQDTLLGKASISDVLFHVEPNGFDVLPAASGVPELNDLKPELRNILIDKLEPLLSSYDFIFMDLGAGISENVQTFAAMSAVRIVIITPEPTSLTDGYALIKVLNNRFGMKDFMILVNEATSSKEAQNTYNRLKTACTHFLRVDPVFLGYVPRDVKLPEAVCRQKPLLTYAPNCPASRNIYGLAEKMQKMRLSMADWLATRTVLQRTKES